MIHSLVGIVGRSLRRHALSTAVTTASAALASGLVMAVYAIAIQSTHAFSGGHIGYDAVLGARGSELQLVLNTVYHLETSPGNLPWSMYQEIARDPRVALAVPYAVGDNYKGYRIVGTTDQVFTDFEYQAGKHYEVQPPGTVFDPSLREVVVGASAARELGLALGDEIQPYHGLSYDSNSQQHPEVYTVVGILRATNTPADRVLWIPIEGIFRMQGHKLRGTGEVYEAEAGVEIPDAHKEVSAVMLKLKGPMSGFQLQNQINREGKAATLAWPIGKVMADFMSKMGWMNRVLELVAGLVVLVAGGSLLAALYNTMNERRKEFAVLRALGARRRTVFSVILMEATTIAVWGALLGYAVYFAILAVAAGIVRQRTGVVLDLFLWHPALLWTPLVMAAVGALAGILPALKAYGTDVAEHLARG